MARKLQANFKTSMVEFMTPIGLIIIFLVLFSSNELFAAKLQIVDMKTQSKVDSLESTPINEMILYRHSVRSPQLKVLLLAGVHGNEAITVEFLNWLMKNFKTETGPLAELAENRRTQIDFLPIANTHGYYTGRRLNKNDVDLNRNYSVEFSPSLLSGAKPFSENETRAIANLLQTEKYHLAIDIHGHAKWVILPSKLHAQNAKHATKYEQLYRTIRNALPHLGESYDILSTSTLGHGGSFEDWAHWVANTPAFCLELALPTRFSRYGSDYFVKYEKFITQVIKSLDSGNLIKSFTSTSPYQVSSGKKLAKQKQSSWYLR